MARLLIHTKEAPAHPTDKNINIGQFQPGHVITIIEDGQQFGRLDVGSHTAVVEIPGALKADLAHLMACDNETTKTIVGGEEIITEKFLGLRLWCAKDLNALKLVSGLATVTKGQEAIFTDTYFKVEEKVVDVPVVKK